tara:strand:- start:58 stop:1308 length:1251 start_codon:yes stop_codon:yes gene_type:complete
MNNLSSSFNLESLNLDIETYNKEELMQILKLPNDYSTDQVTKNKNSLQDKINKLSIDNSKKYSYLLFLDNAEKKLLNNYFNSNGQSTQEAMVNSLTNMELKNNIISNYDSNFIIENKSIIHNPLKNVTVGQYNDNIRIKHVSVNSIFRPNYYNTQSSNFSIILPETINNVTSMRLSSMNFPFSSMYNISNELENNTFSITDNSSNLKHNIDLSDGLYTIIGELFEPSEISLFNIIQTKITNINIDISLSYHSLSKKFYFTNNNPDLSYSLDFTNNDKPLTLGVGWLLGFRAGSYILDKNSRLYAEASNLNSSMESPSIQRDFYLSINDFQNNTVNKFSSAFSESLLPSNIICSFNFAYIYYVNNSDTVDRTRYYDGPTQINKLSFTIYDNYGRIVNLNNNDWSCVLTFEHYRAVQN